MGMCNQGSRAPYGYGAERGVGLHMGTLKCEEGGSIWVRCREGSRAPYGYVEV